MSNGFKVYEHMKCAIKVDRNHSAKLIFKGILISVRGELLNYWIKEDDMDWELPGTCNWHPNLRIILKTLSLFERQC